MKDKINNSVINMDTTTDNSINAQDTILIDADEPVPYYSIWPYLFNLLNPLWWLNQLLMLLGLTTSEKQDEIQQRLDAVKHQIQE